MNASLLYLGHRDRAKKRGIPFLMTLKEWINEWETALGTHWRQLRGRGANKFCMARFGDKGPYKVGNVKIVTNAQNAREVEWGRDKRLRHSEIMLDVMGCPMIRLRCSQAKKGKPGRPWTDEQKRKLSRSTRGVRSPGRSAAKMGEKNPNHGRSWYHQGDKSRCFMKGQQPYGWKLGRPR